MGDRGIQIVKMDVDELILLLNKALADEWLAHYQYWVGAKVVAGPMKDAVIAELDQHAMEERQHADMVADRIDQLGGTPVLSPGDWMKLTNCEYEPPEDNFVENVLEQNIRGEQCAISVYDDLMQKTRETDQITYNMALTIIEQEVEHEQDLQDLFEDLKLMLDRYGMRK